MKRKCIDVDVSILRPVVLYICSLRANSNKQNIVILPMDCGIHTLALQAAKWIRRLKIHQCTWRHISTFMQQGMLKETMRRTANAN